MRLIILLVLVSIRPLLAQKSNFVDIKAFVLEKKSKKPIPGAVCYLKNNEHIGNLTDAKGCFTFKFPKELTYDSLVISFLGYKRLNTPLRLLKLKDDTLFFKLERNTIILDDLVIEAKRFDLKRLVLKAVENIPKNFPDKPHLLNGLYRKVSTQDNQYTHLEEAAISVQDDNYKKPTTSAKIQVHAFRESKDWGNMDSITLKVVSKIQEKASDRWGITTNPLNKLYESNYIRFFNRADTYFNLQTLNKYIDEHYLFELMDISTINGDTIYQIAFSEGGYPPPPSGRTYMKINAEDFAIVEFQITSSRNGSLIHQVLMKYQKIAGRYYPKFFRVTAPRLINQDMEDGEYNIATYWFDEVKVKDFEKIKQKHVNDPFDSEWHKNLVGDPGFWHTYEMLIRYPLEQGIRTSLEIHQPLEVQFGNHE